MRGIEENIFMVYAYKNRKMLFFGYSPMLSRTRSGEPERRYSKIEGILNSFQYAYIEILVLRIGASPPLE